MGARGLGQAAKGARQQPAGRQRQVCCLIGRPTAVSHAWLQRRCLFFLIFNLFLMVEACVLLEIIDCTHTVKRRIFLLNDHHDFSIDTSWRRSVRVCARVCQMPDGEDGLIRER